MRSKRILLTLGVMVAMVAAFTLAMQTTFARSAEGVQPKLSESTASWDTITFDSEAVTYTLTAFGGAASTVITDPTDSGNMVGQFVKPAGAETWAGVTVSTGPNLSVAELPFTASDTTMTVRVWSPDAGTPVLLKVEDAADDTKFVEVLVNTTVAGDWETMTFDFASPTNGTLNMDTTYNKVSIFPNFDNTGVEKTYYFDDVMFVSGGTPPPSAWDTITFDSEAVTYTLTAFGGAASTVITDPTDSGNMVGQFVKPAGAETWAGVTVSTGPNLSVAELPFTASDTTMTVRVWSPDAGTPVLLKVEDAADDTKFVEVLVNTTVAGDWETMTFDFASPTNGTLNMDTTYNKVSIFPNFNNTGVEKTYYFDDVMFVSGGTPPPPQSWDTITFDSEPISYTLTGFEGAEASSIVVDPTDSGNKVGKVVKSATAQPWAGATVSTGPNLSVPELPFTANDTRMTVRTWSPDAGITVRLKVEDAADSAKFVEVDATTTVASDWETLTFDFANPAGGALNMANTYNKISIFFNFGVDGATAGEKTYYFDDVAFIGGTTPPPAALNVGFSSDIYSVFEGGMVTVTANMNMTSTDTVTVDYMTADGTATAGSDYTAVSGTLTFAPGESSQSFTISTTDDDVEERDETVTVSLSNVISAELGSPSSATFYINDNDQVAPEVRQVVDDFESGLPTGKDENDLGIGFITFGQEAGATVSITTTEVADSDPLALPEQSGTNTIFELEVEAPSYGGSTHAFENEAVDTWTPQDWSDYAGITFWLYGQNSGNDLLFEINENRNPNSTSNDAEVWSTTIKDTFSGWRQIALNFENDFNRKDIGNGAPNDDFTRKEVHGWAFLSLTTGGETYTYYLDNVGLYGTAPPPELSVAFAEATYSVTEGDTAVLTASLSVTSTAPVTVTYRTAESQATPDVDFTPVSGTLVFAPGVEHQSFSVPTIEDTVDELDERVMVNLYDAQGAAMGFQRRTTLTILDNDEVISGTTPLADFDGFHSFQVTGPITASFTTLPESSTNALPSQTGSETVLTLQYDDTFTQTKSLIETFKTPQDWSSREGLSFWFYGTGSGDTITTYLYDNQITDTNSMTTSEWELVWSDEFNDPAGTTPDPNNWRYEIGDGSLNGLNGWGNSEFQYYTNDPANASTDGNGSLVLRMNSVNTATTDLVCWYGPCEYTSARLLSADRAEFQYGKIEARVKLPPTDKGGIWPAFWMLGTKIDEGVNWPLAGEIDIMEYVSRIPNEIFGTLHGPGYSGGQSHGDELSNIPNLLDDYHTYTIEWREDHIIWYFDDQKYFETRATDPFFVGDVNDQDDDKQWVYNQPFYLLLNVAIGGNFGGDIEDGIVFPQDTLVDYVRVYQAPSSAERFEATFVDDFTGWQNIVIPFSDFTRSSEQADGAPDDDLGLTEVNGYGFSFPGSSSAVRAADAIRTYHMDRIRAVTDTAPQTPSSNIWFPIMRNEGTGQ